MFNVKPNPEIFVKISVAMTTYNGQRFLREQLNSLAAQTRLPDELVVNDDGSTDATIRILNDFAQHAPFTVKIYSNVTQLGFADNFLQAASLCSGEWVAFCDQDDVWLPNKLERCSRECIDPSVVFIAHSGQVVDQKLDSMGWQVPSFTEESTRLPLQGDPWSVYAGFSTLIRRDILTLLDGGRRPAHPYLPGVRQSHDRWAYFLAFVFGNTKVIPDCLVLYRQHHSNVYGVRKTEVRKGVYGSFGSSAHFLKSTALSAAAHAEQLEYGSASMAPRWAGRAVAGAEYYRRLQRWLSGREEIHDLAKNLFRRCITLLGIVIGRGYRPIANGGLGKKAFIKDVLMCFIGPNLMNKINNIYNNDRSN